MPWPTVHPQRSTSNKLCANRQTSSRFSVLSETVSKLGAAVGTGQFIDLARVRKGVGGEMRCQRPRRPRLSTGGRRPGLAITHSLSDPPLVEASAHRRPQRCVTPKQSP
jgi:hypothetical protein